MDTKVIIQGVRFSYCNVFKPTAVEEGGEAKYNVSVIISKSDKAAIKKINAAIAAATELGKSSKWNGKVPKFDSPLRDGDEDRPDDEAYENSYYLSARSGKKPGVVDKNLDEIMDADEFYSGCFGNVSVTFFPFNVGVNKGIGVGLNNVMKTKDGDHLGGGSSSAADDFAELAGGSDEDDEL